MKWNTNIMKILTTIFVLLMVVVWHSQNGLCAPSPPPRKTQCIATGNAYFFKMCSKKTGKCWLEFGIQFFMYNGGQSRTRRFVFRCTVRYGYQLRKQQTATEIVILKYQVNALGGAIFTWPGIKKDKVKKRHKHHCTCTVSTLK